MAFSNRASHLDLHSHMPTSLGPLRLIHSFTPAYPSPHIYYLPNLTSPSTRIRCFSFHQHIYSSLTHFPSHCLFILRGSTRIYPLQHCLSQAVSRCASVTCGQYVYLVALTAPSNMFSLLSTLAGSLGFVPEAALSPWPSK